MEIDVVYNEDCLLGLKKLPDNSVDCCVTSPPYYALRDYGVDGQIGLEETPQAYIDRLTEVFMEVYRVLKSDGTLWVNIGDSYNGYKGNAKSDFADSEYVGVNVGHPTRESGWGLEDKTLKPKDLIGIPWMLAFNLRSKGWYLRQDIIWHKPNPMPESITDRCVKSHEYIFLLSKSNRYYFNNDAIKEQAVYVTEVGKHPFGGKKYGDNDDKYFRTKSGKGYKPRFQNQGYAKAGGHRDNSGGFNGNVPVRNKRDVWSIPTKPDTVAHFATYPEELIRPCILAGCPMGGVVLDPFMGSGTTARCARRWNRHFIGFELNPEYIKIINKKINVETDMFAE